MLIETDGLDWDEPIAYFDGASPCCPAILISKNYKSSYSSRNYAVIVFRGKDVGDVVYSVDETGKADRRVIYNCAKSEVTDDLKVMSEEMAENIEKLGKF